MRGVAEAASGLRHQAGARLGDRFGGGKKIPVRMGAAWAAQMFQLSRGFDRLGGCFESKAARPR